MITDPLITGIVTKFVWFEAIMYVFLMRQDHTHHSNRLQEQTHATNLLCGATAGRETGVKQVQKKNLYNNCQLSHFHNTDDVCLFSDDTRVPEMYCFMAQVFIRYFSGVLQVCTDLAIQSSQDQTLEKFERKFSDSIVEPRKTAPLLAQSNTTRDAFEPGLDVPSLRSKYSIA